MKRSFKVILLISTLWFAVHESFIIIDGINDNPSKSDYAVIFGNTVNPDGTLSNRLKARVDKGIELYNDTLISKFFVSGGLGKEGHFEGTKMAEYLMSKGVPKNKIVIDNNGNNTQSTAHNFVNEVGNTESIIVVTQFYHITRSKLAFRNAGVQQICSAHADYFEFRDLYSLIREFFWVL